MTAIVGRAGELADIERALADASAGRGRLLLVSGQAGIGKSRLADAAAAMAQRRGMTVASGYAVDDPGAPALWPWLRLMRNWTDGNALPQVQPGSGDSDSAARFRLFVAVADLLRERAAAAGLLLILEDMHWADRTSVLLLRHLVAEIGDERLAIVVTCRDGVAGPLLDLIPDLLRGDAVRPIAVAGLSAEDVAAWLPSLTGGADDGLATALHQRTGGVPLLVRLIAEDLAFRTSNGDAAALGALMADRPQLRRLVAGRVGVLAPDVRAVVDAGSVLGERLAADVLAAMTDQPERGVKDLMDAALAAGVFRTAGATGGLQFQHALVRDAVYAELAPGRRAELHRSAATALQTIRATELAGSIAHHWQRADGPDALAQCRRWAERADDQARTVLAFDDAARFARLAVTCARETQVADAEVARLLLRLADALFLANYLSESVQACVSASDLAVAAGRADLAAQAALVVHGVGDPRVNRTISLLCERALAALPADEHSTRARLQAQIAVGVAESEGGTRPAELAAAALAEAERSEDPVAILEAVAARHLAITVPETVEERLELGRRAVELGAAARQPVAALWGHLWRADAAFQLGNLSVVDSELAEIDRVARERGSALARWHHHRHLAVRHALVGDFDSARGANEAADTLARRVGDLSMLGMTMAFQTILATVRGSIDEMWPGWEELVASAPSMPLVRVTYPLLHAVEGRMDLARAEFEEFRHLPRTFPVGIRWAPTVAQIGVAAVLLDDAEVCSDIYQLLAPLAAYFSGDGSGAVFSHGSMARVVGDLALGCGRVDDAVRHYRDGVAMNARIGARPYTALSRLGWARALLGRGHGEDLPAAAELADTAAAEFRRLDMPGPLAKATRTMEAIANARRSASPLSAREAEVAALVAQALSNRDIAARLVLSERTVESHVRSVLAKLGFASRTEIATWAIRDAATRPPPR